VFVRSERQIIRKKTLVAFVLLCYTQMMACDYLPQTDTPPPSEDTVIEAVQQADTTNALLDRITGEVISPPVAIERRMVIDEDDLMVFIPWVNDERYSVVNEKIEEFITNRIDFVMSRSWNQGNGFFMSFDYEITYNKNEILSFSILEKSYLVMRPYFSISGMNFDLQSGDLVPITSLVIVDEICLQNLSSNQGGEYWRDPFPIDFLLNYYGTVSPHEILQSTTGSYHGYFFSDEYVYVSFGLSQNLGFYIVFRMDWEEARPA